MKWYLSSLGLGLVLCVNGCGDSTNASLPAAPEWDGLPTQAAETVRAEYEAFLGSPSDHEAAGQVAMQLHAYEMLEASEGFYAYAEALSSSTAAWPYLRGVVLEDSGDRGGARDSYRRALSISPADVPTRLRLAALMVAEGELTEAEELYRSVLGSRPTSATAEYGLGVVAAARGEDSQAVRRLERALEVAPQFAPARYALAGTLGRLGKQEGAERHLALLESTPRVEQVYHDPLMFELEGLLVGSAPEHLRRGKQLADRGMHQEAIAEYDKALAIDPSYAVAHVNLMESHGALGRQELVERHYKRAVALGSEAPELHHNLGVLRSLQGRFPEAIQAFERALESNAAFADAHNDLGYALEQLGRSKEAVAQYRAAIEDQPKHRMAHFHLGARLLTTGPLEASIEHLENAVRPLDARSPLILFTLAEAQTRIGRRQAARESLTQAIDAARRFEQADLLARLEAALEGLAVSGDAGER